MSSSTSYPNSHPPDTPYDHRSILNVLGWYLATAATLIVITRITMRIIVSRKLGADDGLILGSLFLALCQTGVLSLAVAHDFGLIGVASPSQLRAQEKSIYSFNIIFVISQCLAKCSVVCFIRTLTPVKTHRKLCLVLLATIVLWTISAFFALVFQCDTPEVWRSTGNHCVNRVALFSYIEVFNILLDTGLILLPAIITWSLQIAKRRKLLVIFTFATRIVVIAAIIAQLAIIYSPPMNQDPILNWAFALTTQLVEYLSIASACGPYLKPFLENISSGMLRSDDLRRREGLTVHEVSSDKSTRHSRLWSPSSNASRRSSEQNNVPPGVISVTNEFSVRAMPSVSEEGIEIENWEATSESSTARFLEGKMSLPIQQR